jgi:hypothetical protein
VKDDAIPKPAEFSRRSDLSAAITAGVALSPLLFTTAIAVFKLG